MIALPQGVKIGSFTREKLADLWEKFRQYDALFPQDFVGTPEDFYKEFLTPTTFVCEIEQGIVWLRKLKIGDKAEAHFAFWDHKLSNKTETIKELLIYAFLSFDLYRIETFVASYARAVRRFIERKLGFIYEGTLRESMVHNGLRIDMHVYSILRDEVL